MQFLNDLPKAEQRKWMYQNYPEKALATNIAQMRKAFAAWKVAKSNAQLETVLVELVESVDAVYMVLKKNHSADFKTAGLIGSK